MRQGGYCIPWFHISIWVWSIGTVCFPQGLTTASYLTDGISSTLSFLLTARVGAALEIRKEMKDQEIKNFLNSLNDDQMDRLFNSLADLADLMDDGTDADLEKTSNLVEHHDVKLDRNEEKKFFNRVFSRNKRQKGRDHVATRIKTSFEKKLLGVMKEYDCDPLLFDLMVKATICEDMTYFKNSSELQQSSGLEKDDYYKLVDDAIDEIMNKYFDL